MSADLFVEVVNALQTINEKITGIEYAPLLEDYPPAIDTAMINCVLTTIGEGTEWSIQCTDPRVFFRVTMTIFLQPLGQGDFGSILEEVQILGGAFRAKYFDATTYLYNDGYRKLILEENGLRAYINPQIPWGFSGHVVTVYPIGSEHAFHTCRVTLGVIGSQGGC